MKNINIFGKSIVIDYLLYQPSNVLSISITEEINQEIKNQITILAKKHKIPVHQITKNSLDKIAKDITHTQVMATLKPYIFGDHKKWLDEINDVQNIGVVILAGLNDQINFGGVLRSAAASGMSAVFITSHGQAKITDSTYHSAAGSLGKIPIFQIHSIADLIKELKNKKFWIYAMDGEAQKSYTENDYKNQNTAFLLGREGTGLTNRELDLVDEKIKIPMHNNVESLNASVSAGIIFFDWSNRK